MLATVTRSSIIQRLSLLRLSDPGYHHARSEELPKTRVRAAGRDDRIHGTVIGTIPSSSRFQRPRLYRLAGANRGFHNQRLNRLRKEKMSDYEPVC